MDHSQYNLFNESLQTYKKYVHTLQECERVLYYKHKIAFKKHIQFLARTTP